MDKSSHKTPFCGSVRPSVRPSVTPFWLCSPHRIIMKFSGVITKCPCMDWNKKTHKLWSFVSKCPCMDCSFLQNTTSVAIFWYSWYFCGYFVYLQPHKTDSHKTPFCGSGRSHTKPNSHTGKRHPNLWTKVATRHRFVGPSVRLSVCPSVCHTFLTMFSSSYHHEIFRSYY